MRRSAKIALLIMGAGSLAFLTYQCQPTTLTDPDRVGPEATSHPTPPVAQAIPAPVEEAGETPAQAGAVTQAGNNYTSHVYMHHIWWHQTYGSPYIGGSYSGSSYVSRPAPPAPSQAAHAAPSSRGGFGSAGSGGSS